MPNHFQEKIADKIVKFDDLSALAKKLRPKRVVFTAGGFDLIHVGHTRYLAESKAKGDILVVGVSSNAEIKLLKGHDRPIVDESARVEMIASLMVVDFVFIMPPLNAVVSSIVTLCPKVLVVPDDDWNTGYKDSPEALAMDKCGGEVVMIPRQGPYISSSGMIEKAAAVMIRTNFQRFFTPEMMKELKG
ncbi:adenylyltransferase/cytidyltransferase family protein [Candidatus Collierbacteria bacterium]|nr:adenylyltransferase/cytidyltransferase family protein [Candidatus Collierbacteria bacterium]